MDILEKWDDIKNYFGKNKKKKKIQEEDPDASWEDESPNSPSAKGSTGLIPGIKRQWVRGGAIFLTIVFVLAVIYGTDMGEEQSKNQSNLTHKNDLPLNSAEDAKRATGAADDYQALLDANRKQQALAGRNQQNPQQNPQNVQAVQQGNTNQQQQQVRQQPSFAQPYTLPSQSPQQFANQYAQQQALLQQQQEEEKRRREKEASEKSLADKIKNSFQSAIAFSLGNGSGSNGGNNGNAAATATPTASVQQTPYTGERVSTASYAPVSGIYTAVGPRTLVAGTLIPVMLLTGINTDSPGQVMCQVQSDIYDFNGTSLLIPAGSRLLGTYDANMVSNGRVSVTFSSLQTTDGGSWAIGNSIVAIDGAGYTGISGKVHKHTAQKISGGLMGSAIAALGSLAAGNTSSVNTYSAGQIAAQGALANLINTTSSMFQSAANIQNTVTVDPGYMFNVYVTNNINF